MMRLRGEWGDPTRRAYLQKALPESQAAQQGRHISRVNPARSPCFPCIFPNVGVGQHVDGNGDIFQRTDICATLIHC